MWLAFDARASVRACERILGLHEDYDLASDPPGDHTIRISELPGIAGLRVRAIHKTGSETPTIDLLNELDWRLEGKPLKATELPAGVLVDFEADDWGQGRFKRINLTYRVGEKPQPILSRLKLRAEAPHFIAKSALVYRDVNSLLSTLLAIGALIGLAGLISQGIRLARRARNRQSEIGNRESPP